MREVNEQEGVMRSESCVERPKYCQSNVRTVQYLLSVISREWAVKYKLHYYTQAVSGYTKCLQFDLFVKTPRTGSTKEESNEGDGGDGGEEEAGKVTGGVGWLSQGYEGSAPRTVVSVLLEPRQQGDQAAHQPPAQQTEEDHQGPPTGGQVT